MSIPPLPLPQRSIPSYVPGTTNTMPIAKNTQQENIPKIILELQSHLHYRRHPISRPPQDPVPLTVPALSPKNPWNIIKPEEPWSNSGRKKAEASTQSHDIATVVRSCMSHDTTQASLQCQGNPTSRVHHHQKYRTTQQG